MINILVYIALSLIGFLIIRELVTWYFKLNEIVSLLREIRDNTKSRNLSSSSDPVNKAN